MKNKTLFVKYKNSITPTSFKYEPRYISKVFLASYY
jgi:hypothetical protein